MAGGDAVSTEAAPEGGSARINRIKLLVALDALLREGSVSGAAASMGMQTSAMSRLLGELRDLYNDRIFIRTGRGMRPTPFAESLRMRVRALAAETDSLLDGDPEHRLSSAPASVEEWQQKTQIPPTPLSVTRADQLEAAPSPAGKARRLAAIGNNADPHRRLAKSIAITAPGPGRSRPLTLEEARDALGIILRGEADPAQIGALLMTIQYRGATAVELAGFVQAVRAEIGARPTTGAKPDLDWPAYLSPRWRSPPWFIHAARLVAMAGHRVLLHGHFGAGADSGKLEAAANDAGIPVCLSLSSACEALDRHSIAYTPLGAFAPRVQSLLGLYPLFEMRTPINGAVHLINPLDAPATIVGAAQTSKRDIYRDIARLLDADRFAVIGSIRDFAQVTPGRTTPIYRIVKDQDADIVVPASKSAKSERGVFSQREYWHAIWSGAARDEQAEATIINTAAAAFLCLSENPKARFEDAADKAAGLWAQRRR
jgi:anthranilate phosphoribosyltransferase